MMNTPCIYEVNVGFTSAVATVKIFPDDHDDRPNGFVMKWLFNVDSIKGWSMKSYANIFDELSHHIVRQ